LPAAGVEQSVVGRGTNSGVACFLSPFLVSHQPLMPTLLMPSPPVTAACGDSGASPRDLPMGAGGAELEQRVAESLKAVGSMLLAMKSHEEHLRQLQAMVVGVASNQTRPFSENLPIMPVSEKKGEASSKGQGHRKLGDLLDPWAEPVDDVGINSSLSLRSERQWARSGALTADLIDSSLSVPAHLGDSVKSIEGGESKCVFVWVPGSPSRIAWDLFSLFLIAWDLTVLPLIAFGIEEQGFLVFFGWVSTCFWASDLCCNFFVAFYRKDGLVEMRLKAIAKQYLLRWFWMDLCIVAVDIFSRLMFVGSGGVLGRLGKTMRIVRITKAFRMMRLARAMKFVMLFESLVETISSKSVAAVVMIFRLLFEVALAVHFIACGWFAVGTAHGHDVGWVAAFDATDTPYLYLMSFHWTIAQFTPAPNNVHPTNFSERLYATVVLFVGLVIFSSLIGRVTALVTKRQQEATEHMLDCERLRLLCKTRNVSLQLSNRLLHCASRNPGMKKLWVLEEDVACLSKMPKVLLFDLRYDLYGSTLSISPLFRLDLDPLRTLVKHLCRHAVREAPLPAHELLFHANEIGTQMYFVVNGEFVYTRDEIRGVTPRISTKIGDQACLCEGVLWTLWKHRGHASALTYGSVVLMPSDAFRRIACSRSAVLNVLRRYAQHFMCRLADASRESKVDDQWTAFGEEEDLCEILLKPPAA